MSQQRGTPLRTLSTGIEKLDLVLGGGLPEYSLTILAGEPGSGKTVLGHHIAFAASSPERPAVHFAMLGEPSLKRLHYQQSFSFFDLEKVGRSVHFEDLSSPTLKGDLFALLDAMMEKIEKHSAGLVIVDSFRTIIGSTTKPANEDFLQELALRLTAAQTTTILIGEYARDELQQNPLFAIADGVLALTQNLMRNSMVRKMRVHKLRGMNSQPGLHTFRITRDGFQLFPRMLTPPESRDPEAASGKLISTGIPGLDELLGGGTFEGSSLILAGPSGSGKSTVGIQFIAEGVRHGEPAVLALFEETVPKAQQQAKGFSVDLQQMVDAGLLELVYIRPLDLSVDETLYAIQEAIKKVGARRLVIDSISALEVALAPSFQEDFRESLYRLTAAVTAARITILMTVEITTSYEQLQFTPHAISFLTHDIILQRYFEMEGRLRTFISVIKTRGRRHSQELREYTITSGGLQVGSTLTGYQGLITAVPQPIGPTGQAFPGLTEAEARLLTEIRTQGDATLRQLKKFSGLSEDGLTRALRRLVELGYAKRVSRLGRKTFQALASK